MVTIMNLKSVSIFLLFFLFILPVTRVSAQPDLSSRLTGTGTITGRILMKGGGSMAGGTVLFYDASLGPPPFKNEIRRLPELRVDIDADSRFKAELPAGTHYLWAFKRIFTEKTNPLQDGDYVYSSVNEKGEAKEYVIKSGEILNIGTVSDAVPYKKTDQVIRTGIAGVIRDSQGKPVEGASVFVFVDDSLTKKPVFFSRKTGSDGKYIVSVPPGTYYLRARSNLRGGRPDAGQLLGTYGGDNAAPVTVRDGEIKTEVNIIVLRFLGRNPNPEIGPKSRFQ